MGKELLDSVVNGATGGIYGIAKGDSFGKTGVSLFGGPAGVSIHAATKKKSSPGKNSDKALADAALELLSVSRGTRKEYFAQLAEALTTGTIQARRPEINYGVEQALQAGSGATTSATDALATIGQARTPFGQAAIAEERRKGAQTAGATPADIINQIILGGANSTLLQASGQGLQGAGTVAGIATQRAIAEGTANTNALGSVFQGVGGLAGVGAGAYQNYQLQQLLMGPRPTQQAAI